jgi:ATP-dependent helicase/nuclease subunit A
MTVIADQSERDLIRKALDCTLIVEAAAGTGKTTELVWRITEVLATGATSVDRIVAVTFTDKAAGELKLRLRAALDHERADAPADSQRYKNLEQALALLEEARAGTIHSFCADLLREHPVEAAIDPEAACMDDAEARRLYGAVFDLWLQQVLEDPPEGIRRSLRRPSEEGPAERLIRAGWELCEWRDFNTDWQRVPWERNARIDEIIPSLQEFSQLTVNASNTRDPLYLATAPARQLVNEIQALERAQARDYDEIEAALVRLAADRDFCNPRTGRGNFYGPNIRRQQVLEGLQDLASGLQQFVADADADLAALLQRELRASINRYEDRKRQLGKLDFLDLLLLARNLLRDNEALRAELQMRFTHLFVDEFQDTDPLQAEVLLLLSADDVSVNDWRKVRPVPGKLFLVADPKQSIYRFRRADIGLYCEIRDMLTVGGAQLVKLRTSFRSDPSIQNLVNATFAVVMDGDPVRLQAEYVPLAPYRSHQRDQPSIVVLSVPQPFGKTGKITETAIRNSLPDATAAFVEWLLGSGWTVTGRGQQHRVPISPRHICLLFSQFQNYGADTVKPYADALQARGIPHLLIGGKTFYQREEVGTIRTALASIEWPDDELSIYATLHGSLFAIPDNQLLEYRQRFRRLHPFRVPQDIPGTLRAIGEALELLAELHRNRNYHPVAYTLNLLLERTRAHVAFVLRPSGEQVLANVLHVAELARAYEASGGISFRGFVQQLTEDASKSGTPDAAIFEEGAEGVRLMTVHRAKGLEFPVVIMAHITAKITSSRAHRFLDNTTGLCAVRLAGWSPRELLAHETEEIARDRAEGERLAYIAATRARDLLVIPAAGDDPTGRGPERAKDWWVGPLYPGIYPPGDSRSKPLTAKQCPKFANDTAIRPIEAPRSNSTTIYPGAHRFGDGEAAYSVVWWDPRTLTLGRVPQFSIRQEALLRQPDDAILNQDIERYQHWREQKGATIERAIRPTLHIKTVTEQAKTGYAGDGIDFELIEVPRDEGRPIGPRFGSLVHATLASVPLDGDTNQIESLARFHARILGASYEETQAARRVVETVLQHPLLLRAHEAALKDDCRRECPVTLVADDGSIVEGVVDLAYLDAGHWTVVDFKTDQQVERAMGRYRSQALMYASSISLATGLPAVVRLMRI